MDENSLVERLRATVRSDGEIIAGPTDLDLEAAAAIERLLAERDEARKALKPFATMATCYPDAVDDAQVVDYGWPIDDPSRNQDSECFTVGDLRRARQALEEKP